MVDYRRGFIGVFRGKQETRLEWREVGFTLDFIGFYGDFCWLPRRDSNPNKQNQNLPTMPYLQGFAEKLVANGGLPLTI